MQIPVYRVWGLLLRNLCLPIPVSIFFWCHTGMFFKIFSERELFRKMEFFGNLLDNKFGFIEQIFGIGDGKERNPFRGCLSGGGTYDVCEMVGRQLGLFGVKFDTTFRFVMIEQRDDELVDKVALSAELGWGIGKEMKMVEYQLDDRFFGDQLNLVGKNGFLELQAGLRQ